MTTLVTDYGVWVLFLWVLGNQAGVPVPVVPALLVAGAIARGTGDLTVVLAVVVGAAVCADLAWYSLGRWRGARVLAWLRRFRHANTVIDRAASLSPTRQIVFLVSTRFLPEVNPVAAALAGATRVKLRRYMLVATGAALVWAGTWAGLGYALGGAMGASPAPRAHGAELAVSTFRNDERSEALREVVWKDATAAFSWESMHAAHELNGPTFAHEILTTSELIAALPKSR